MKKMIGLALYGLIMFGISAGGVLYLRSQQPVEVTEDDSDADDVPALDPEISPLSPAAEPQGPSRDELMPVPVRPKSMTVEEIVQIGLGLNERERAIREREAALDRAEQQHKLLLADIQAEQQESMGLLATAKDQKEAADELLRQVKTIAATVLKDREALQKERKELETEREKMRQEAVNRGVETPEVAKAQQPLTVSKGVVEVYENMEPAETAKSLEKLANSGELRRAAEILGKLQPRTAAEVAEAIQDDVLRTEVLTEVDRLNAAKAVSATIRQ